MRRLEKSTIYLALVLSLITLIGNLVNYRGTSSLIFALIVLLFNFVFLLMAFWFADERMMAGKPFISFLTYLVIAIFLYFYTLGGLFKILYGSFLTFGGAIFFLKIKSLSFEVLFLIFSMMVIFSLGMLFFHMHKKDFRKKKVRKRYLFLILLFLIIVVIFLPRPYVNDTSPIIYFFKGLVSPFYLTANLTTPTNFTNISILNIPGLTEKPNIIFIVLESVSASHLGYAGYARNVSPNIDSLASRGIVFENAYSASSHTDQAVPTFLSSRYTLNREHISDYSEDYPRTFIWDILKKNGYNTSFVSSQNENWLDMDQYYNKTTLDLFWDSSNASFSDFDDGEQKLDYTVNTSSKAISWLDSLGNSSFFLYLNLQEDHFPYIYPEKEAIFLPDQTSVLTNYLSIADRDINASINRYDNALHYMDKSIGGFISSLRERGLLNNTIIVLSADHGEALDGRHGNVRHGFGVYEDLIKVPLIFVIPGQKHEVINDNVRTIDVVPTILNITGFSLSENFQGRIMAKNSDVFSYTVLQNRKIGLIRDDLKYILDLNSYLPEVYNLSSDPLERDNLVKEDGDAEHYFSEYGNTLLSWYNCQINYYAEKMWMNGTRINC